MTLTVHLLEMTGLVEENSVVLWEINQAISFSGVSRGKYFHRNLEHTLLRCVSGLKKRVEGVTERLVHT